MTFHSPASRPNPDQRKNSHVIGIVDPVSGGAYLAERLLARGIGCVAITTAPGRHAGLAYLDVLDLTSTTFEAELEHYRFAAILPGAESGVLLAELLSTRFGLPGNDPLSSHLRRNKVAMAEAVDKVGIAICRQARVTSLETCVAWARSSGFPVVVKPEASSGSDLVRRCMTEAQLRRHASLILGGPDKYGRTTESLLLQEWMRGDEYTVDGVVTDGALRVFAVGRYRKITRDGAMIYDRIDFFAPDDRQIDPRILAYATAVAQAVEVRVGPVHAEIMLTPEGPRLVEIAARAHGGIGTAVIDRHVSPSFIDAILAAAEGGQADAVPVTQRRAAAIAFLINDAEGALVSMPGEQMIRALPSFVSLTWLAKPGERLARTMDLATCPGLVELAHDDQGQIDADIGRLRGLERDNRLLEMAR
ncbi:ATP-grasp domain-containing protein [Allorhizobium sp. BGMRC 0089]|uniref:ATP-grasp domain-containing protein n=1 Tax=Allorhizobium sonneratiae TaxID=2934936 RepID=UPI00203371E6|nr:ATP-grasp domain-containing protein [Allorhizobium sonneratiae]MCM2292721.1 ATP-grasp domain-containing protein [Allorhizobium sonneratiae]